MDDVDISLEYLNTPSCLAGSLQHILKYATPVFARMMIALWV